MIVAIDGPAGTGKSTIAALIAKKTGALYLNSGSFYRALTLALIESGMGLDDEGAVVRFCSEQKIEYKNSRLILNGRDVDGLLRSDKVSALVSRVSAITELRHLVNARMREITASLSIVCEGRDMTTVVFPRADFKFYLDASLDAQAMRRFKQGESEMTLEQIREAIKKRDEMDRNKKEGSLVRAPDAFYIDTTDLTIDQVCAIIMNKIHGKGSNMETKEVEKDEAPAAKGAIQTQLEESLSSFNPPEDGQIVTGRVVEVTGDTVFIDVGCKSEGRLPIDEFGGSVPSAGDEVQVKLVKQAGKNGPEVSKKQADEKRLWRVITEASKNKAPVQGVIKKTVKGGFEVDLGGNIHAFLPISQSDSQKVEDPQTLVGLKADFYIERLYSDGKANVVVNRRKYLEEKIDKEREKFFAERKIGDTVKGVVKSFTSFGAFVDLGGFDGLLHINDMSWGHVTRPKEFVKKGQEIELKLIRMDPEGKRINLSLKHFTEDPWMHFEDKYHVNDKVHGKVTKLADFGAFIELEEGIEGLAHISEFSWTRKVNKPSDMLKAGDEVDCVILGYDIQAGRVSLGLKQATPNPWDTLGDKYTVGQKLHGKVVKLTNNGAFIDIGDGMDAFLHADDISWTKKVKHPGSELKVGQEIDVAVIDVDTEERRISVGLKQTTDNPWIKFSKEYPQGSTFEGEITSITDFGVFVRAPNGIEGLVGKANLSDDRNVPFEEAVKNFKAGDKINVYVVDVSVEKEKASFSAREFKKAQERAELSQYMSRSTDDGAYTLGDMLQTQKSEQTQA